MKLNVVIPAHNEEGSLAETIDLIYEKLQQNAIDHEILVVNDSSTDKTEEILNTLQQRIPTLNYYNNDGPNGFGYAVRYGLNHFDGDCVAVMMADLSDSPDDLLLFYNKLRE